MAASLLAALLSDFAHNYKAAVEVAIGMYRRLPAAPFAANNAAYALALAGRIAEAKKLLPSPPQTPHEEATTALISLLEGNLGEGISGYRRAASTARKNGNADLAALIQYRGAVAIAMAVGKTPPHPPKEFADDPAFQLLSERMT